MGENEGKTASAGEKRSPQAGRKKTGGPESAEPREGKGAAAGEAAAEGKPAAAKAEKPARPESAASEGPAQKRRGRPARKPSKRYRKSLELVTKERLGTAEAVARLKKMAGGVKFDQTVNIVMLLGIDPKQADQAIRGAVSLPKGIGKARRVICFAEGEDAEKARAAGAVEVGADELIKKVGDGWLDFDVAIAHPRLMGKVGKLGRTLGPTGKMPTPKNGTVTADVATAVKEFAAGKVEFRNDANGNVHGIVGKVSFPDADLVTNIESFIDHIRRMKPQTSKGVYIRKVCISATMSPGVELAVAS